MQPKTSLWVKVNEMPTTEMVCKLKLLKIGTHRKDVYLGCFSDALYRFKDDNFQMPTKMYRLTFETKFEVCRNPPKLKANKEGKLKPIDILYLGDIIAIKLYIENVENIYELQGSLDQLTILRRFLSTKINQMGFHNMFKVFKKIGRGNFASVYLAERIEDQQRMAIKAFSKATVYAELKGKEGLINEIQIMRVLDQHPNIMKLYEVYETENSIYMCLELLEGDQIFEYLKRKVIFSNHQIQLILSGLLMGLKHMHSKGIMHRDLKLENILFKKVDKMDSVVIADFGLATFAKATPYLYSRCGTPGFVAPEIINLKNQNIGYDPVCDIYSLGLIFYILLSGRPAYGGKTYNTLVRQNKESFINFQIPPFELVCPEAKDLLMKMLMKDPSLRVKAQDALVHEYLFDTFMFGADGEEETNTQTDDSPNLNGRVLKMNQQALKMDMERIKLNNQQTPIKLSKNMDKEETFHLDDSDDSDIDDFQLHPKQGEDEIYSRTPVITGRRHLIENSPAQMLIDISPFLGPKKMPEQAKPIEKYSLH